ncbi:hypothetical protein Pelo_2241 [Pelomyxa schiedti]|nr:hypothetical protein Pelo_2241 [Pelomyxa schiedti]
MTRSTNNKIIALVCLLCGCAVSQWCDDPAVVANYWTYVYWNFETTQYGYLPSGNTTDSYTGACSSSQLPAVWYTFQPSVSGQLVVSTCGTTWDTIIEVQGGFSCSDRVCIGINDDGCYPASTLTLSASAYEFYNIKIRPFSYYPENAQYTFTLEFTPDGVSVPASSTHNSYNDFCPSRIYLWDNEASGYYLNSYSEVDTGDCWDNEWLWEYGEWFVYSTSYSSRLSICSELPVTLIFVDDLCEYSTPSCFYTVSSNWEGRDECQYQIEVDMGTYYGWSVDFLVKSQYSGAYISVSTYQYDFSSDDWHFPIWVVILAFSLLLLSLGLFCLLGAYCCHRRIAKKKEQYDHLEDQKDLVEIPSINGQPASTEKTEPTGSNPAPIAPPNVAPPKYTPVYFPFSFFQQAPITPPTQPPPQLYPTITLPTLTSKN